LGGGVRKVMGRKKGWEEVGTGSKKGWEEVRKVGRWLRKRLGGAKC
jgi:hypothetical protein